MPQQHRQGLKQRATGRSLAGERLDALRDIGKDYLSELLTDVNTLLRLDPSPFTATMIAMEIPAAIRPYSIAVAPFWSNRNSIIFCFNFASN